MSAVSCGNGKLRQWLIDQIDSGKYPGLVWENEEKSIFRIPWKHAGKQDYNREEDAALFKVTDTQGAHGRAGVEGPRARPGFDADSAASPVRSAQHMEVLEEGTVKEGQDGVSPCGAVTWSIGWRWRLASAPGEGEGGRGELSK